MGEGIRVSAGGQNANTIANAIIREYLAQSGEISPNNFVEFVRSGSISAGTRSGNLVQNGYNVSADSQAVPLDESHVVVFLQSRTKSSIYNYYAFLFQVTSTTAVHKATLQYGSSISQDDIFDNNFVCVGPNKIVGAKATYDYVQGCVFIVNDARTAISWTGWMNLKGHEEGYSGLVSVTSVPVCLIKEDTVSFAYLTSSGGSTYKVKAFAAKLSGNSFSSVGASGHIGSVSLDSTTATFYNITAAAINEGDVILAYSYKGYVDQSTCARYKVNEDLSIVTGYASISLETYAIIHSITGFDSKAVLVYEYKVTGSYSDSYYQVAVVLYPSGNGIGKSGTVQLEYYSTSGRIQPARLAYLGDGYVLAAYTGYSYSYLTIKLLYVSGYSISVKQTIRPNADGTYDHYAGRAAVCGEFILLPYADNYYYNYVLPLSFPRTVKLATSRIDGIAETKATTSAKGKVAMINKWGV